MDAKQSAAFLYGLCDLKALQGLVEFKETIEKIGELLEELADLQDLLEDMPDFEIEDSMDRDWLKKVQKRLDLVKLY